MKHRLPKICPLLPFALYGVLFLTVYLYFFGDSLAPSVDIFLLVLSLGWIPSLISSVLGIVFSSLALKDGGKKACLICSCVNLAVSIAWGLPIGIPIAARYFSEPPQSASADRQFLFQEAFSHYEFIEKKEIDGKTYSLFLYVSEYADELPFVRVYEGDLESAFKNREKIPYREPVLDEYIGNVPDEDFYFPRYETDIHFSDDGKSVVVEFNNGEKQIIVFNKADTPPAL
ncbi:MAG: hypothetical protein IJP90_14780 [Treponema sp.]|nr:hypothetical protein [Treponema sp.]